MAKNESLSALQICNAAKKKNFVPIYVLMGEESYYIDLISDTSIQNSLTEEEKDFNLSIYYGLDANIREVISTCKRFPVMSERQVVVVKEAQLMDNMELLQHYIEHPQKSTVLVICNKNGNLKAPQSLKMARASDDVVVFESKRVTDYNVGAVITEYVSSKSLKINSKSIAMLKDFVGTDISLLFGEINKLALILPAKSEITPESIEKHIGISKDFNNFELENAIRTRDVKKALQIATYFANNPKSNPTVVTTGLLFSFFSNLMLILTSRDRSEAALMSLIGTKSQYRVRTFIETTKYYSAASCYACIGYLREFDTKSKGINSRQNEYDLFKELIFKIIYS